MLFFVLAKIASVFERRTCMPPANLNIIKNNFLIKNFQANFNGAAYYRFSGTFKSETFEEALQIFNLQHLLLYKIKGNEIYINKK